MTVNLDRIEAVARSAKPGPWGPSPFAVGAVIAKNAEASPTELRDYGGAVVGESLDRNEIRYLMAASPDVVLELIACIRNGWEAVPGPDWTITAKLTRGEPH